MKHNARCRRCGDLLDFLPIPGFRRPGESKYYAVNRDDHLPHWKRCSITIALRERRHADRLSRKPSIAKQQGRLTAKRGAAPITTTGEQLDAFGYP